MPTCEHCNSPARPYSSMCTPCLMASRARCAGYEHASWQGTADVHAAARRAYPDSATLRRAFIQGLRDYCAAG